MEKCSYAGIRSHCILGSVHCGGLFFTVYNDWKLNFESTHADKRVRFGVHCFHWRGLGVAQLVENFLNS